MRSVEYNYEIEMPPGILAAIPATSPDEARGWLDDLFSTLDQMAAARGIRLEPDWQYGLTELDTCSVPRD